MILLVQIQLSVAIALHLEFGPILTKHQPNYHALQHHTLRDLEMIIVATYGYAFHVKSIPGNKKKLPIAYNS